MGVEIEASPSADPGLTAIDDRRLIEDPDIFGRRTTNKTEFSILTCPSSHLVVDRQWLLVLDPHVSSLLYFPPILVVFHGLKYRLKKANVSFQLSTPSLVCIRLNECPPGGS